MEPRNPDVSAAPLRDVILRSEPNWTAVIFFAALSLLHFAIWVPAFMHQRWEGYVSLLFAFAFLGAAVVAFRTKFELAILPGARAIRLRRGTERFHFERRIPFADVHGVRLTISHPNRRREAHIELLCDNEDIDCPATLIPRQQALFLAMLLKVRLIKVSDQDAPDPSEAEVELTSRL
jgi:hypothetical protein